MDKHTAEHVADVLKAVAQLIPGEMCVGEIVERLGEKQAITSQQLNMMKDKGVLGSRRDGSKVYYHIENKNVIRLLDCVYDHCEQEKGGTE